MKARGIGRHLTSAIAGGLMCASASVSPAMAQQNTNDADSTRAAIDELPDDLSFLADVLGLLNLPEQAPVSADQSDRQRAQAVEVTIDENSLINGEASEQIARLLEMLQVGNIYDALNLGVLPGEAPFLEQIDVLQLILENNISIGDLLSLANIARFKFVTESNGVERTHRALLGVPTSLDVDNESGTDVIATFETIPSLRTGLAIGLKVERSSGSSGGWFSSWWSTPAEPESSEPLPLDIRAVLTVPVSALTGGNDPAAQIEFGFASSTGIPQESDLSINLDSVDNASRIVANIDITTEDATDDFRIVGGARQQNIDTGVFDSLADLGVVLSPVPTNLSLDAEVSDALSIALSSDVRTRPVVQFDVPDTARGSLTLDSLQDPLNLLVGTRDGEQVVEYTTADGIEGLRAEATLANGFRLDAGLVDLPPRLTLNFGTGDVLQLDLGGDTIGEITAIASDQPVLPAPRERNGLTLDTRNGTAAAARLRGFAGLTLTARPENVALDLAFQSDEPLSANVRLPDNQYVNATISNLPDSLSLGFEAIAEERMPAIDATYEAESAIERIDFDTNIMLPSLTATLVDLPTRIDICAAQNDYCTGETGGNVIDARIEADRTLTIENAEICVDAACQSGGTYATVSPLALQTVTLSGNTSGSSINRFFSDIPLQVGSVGEFYVDTGGRSIRTVLNAGRGDASIFADGTIAANDWRLNYDLAGPSFDRSGSLSCSALTVDVMLENNSFGGGLFGGISGLFMDVLDINVERLLCNR